MRNIKQDRGEGAVGGAILKCAAESLGQLVHLVEASSCTPNSCEFDSWLGHIPRLREATDCCFSHTSVVLSRSVSRLSHTHSAIIK